MSWVCTFKVEVREAAATERLGVGPSEVVTPLSDDHCVVVIKGEHVRVDKVWSPVWPVIDAAQVFEEGPGEFWILSLDCDPRPFISPRLL